MITPRDIFLADNLRLPELGKGILFEQLRWLIVLRWFAILGIVLVGVISRYSLSVLPSGTPIFVLAGILLACNLAYHLILRQSPHRGTWFNLVFATVQIEADLLLLTLLIHFSGGITNPFSLFYIFHIIIATIMLPRRLSLAIGISAAAMYGIMLVGEWKDWTWFQHHPLAFQTSDLWNSPVYLLGAFTAFFGTVFLVRYLPRRVLVRMAAKEIEANRNRDMLDTVIRTISEGLIVIDSDGDILVCNPAAEQWAPGIRDSLDHFPDELKTRIKTFLAHPSLATGEAALVRFSVAGPEERYIEAHCHPIVRGPDNPAGLVIVGEDMTAHRKLEQDLLIRTEETAEINEMLKMSRIELAQREKMVAIGQMATGIAHEIGNPLTSLSSVVQYLQRKITIPEQTSQLAIIEHQIQRISTILKRMLAVSRPATGEYRWTDINDGIENTLSLIRYDRRAQSLEIRNPPNPDLPLVWLNPFHIEQVILNVVLNALDAMAPVKDRPHVLDIAKRFENDRIEIRISDTGIGMKPETCKRAFESFFTTKELGKGTGLGLFVSYNLVSEIDGTIRLESEIGKGTTVILSIPIRPKNHLIGDSSREQARPQNPDASPEKPS